MHSQALVSSSGQVCHPQQQQQQTLLDHRRRQERDVAKTVELVNMFVISTTQFLSRFAAQCDARLNRVSRTLDQLETRTALLEFKVRSVEGDGESGSSGSSDSSSGSDAEVGKSGGRRDTRRSNRGSSTASGSQLSTSSSSALPKHSERRRWRRSRTPVVADGTVLRIKDRRFRHQDGNSDDAVSDRDSRAKDRGSDDDSDKVARGKRRRGKEGRLEPPQEPPPMPDSRHGRHKKHSPPSPHSKTRPLSSSSGAAGGAPAPIPTRHFPVPPPLPSFGGPTGLPAPPPPPPLPRQLRRPTLMHGEISRAGSGAVYTMRTHPRLRGYFELLVLHVDAEEVRHRMRANGVDPAWLETPDSIAPATFSDYVPDFAVSEGEEAVTVGGGHVSADGRSL